MPASRHFDREECARLRVRLDGAGAAEDRSRRAGFVKGHVFDPADFVIRTDGVCRLNPEMARMVVAKVSA
jgi:hypothetical protein